jgi:hypothetical protein
MAPAPQVGAEHLQILASYAPDALEGDSELAAIVLFAAHLCRTPVAAVTVTGPVQVGFVVLHGTTVG